MKCEAINLLFHLLAFETGPNHTVNTHGFRASIKHMMRNFSLFYGDVVYHCLPAVCLPVLDENKNISNFCVENSNGMEILWHQYAVLNIL